MYLATIALICLLLTATLSSIALAYRAWRDKRANEVVGMGEGEDLEAGCVVVFLVFSLHSFLILLFLFHQNIRDWNHSPNPDPLPHKHPRTK